MDPTLSPEEVEQLWQASVSDAWSAIAIASAMLMLIPVALGLSLGWRKTALVLMAINGLIVWTCPAPITVYVGPLIIAICAFGFFWTPKSEEIGKSDTSGA